MSKQLSVFLENAPGRLDAVLSTLAEAGIDIHAFSIAERTETGILRMLVNDPDKGVAVLSAAGMTSKAAEVILVKIGDAPGSAIRPVRVLAEAGVNVEYAFAYENRTKDAAILILRVNDNALAEEALSGAGIAVVALSDIF
ncbi:MAG: hypothetical protein LBR73_06410 [Oscillospiraceae bacterium]|jgi:hypothetical protein|nr:hypothetical protein [Oscillospiraceae bacterium]